MVVKGITGILVMEDSEKESIGGMSTYGRREGRGVVVPHF